MIKPNKTYDFILFCGDIHANIEIVPNFLKKNGLKNCAVFLVGDFGIGFDPEYKENRRMIYLNERMSCYDSDLFVIRGNHDNPSYFDGNYVLSNVILLEDYSVVQINNYNFLGIGGGISIDRTIRNGYYHPKKQDYWVDEPIVFKKEKIIGLTDIDVVFSHSAPNNVTPLVKNGLNLYINDDKYLLDDVTKERTTLSNIYDILVKNNNIKYWCYGHFHMDSISYINDTKFYAINMNNIIEIRL